MVRFIKNSIPLLEMSLNLGKFKELEISLHEVEALFAVLKKVAPFVAFRVGPNFLEERGRFTTSEYSYKIFRYNIVNIANNILTLKMLKLTDEIEEALNEKRNNAADKSNIQLQLKEVGKLLFTFLRNASIPVTFFVVGNRFPTCFSTLSFIGYNAYYMYNTASDMFANNPSSKDNSNEKSALSPTKAVTDNTNEEKGEKVGSAYPKILFLAVKAFFLNLDIKLLRQQVRAFDPKELFHNSVMQHIINPLPTNLQPWAGTALGSVSLVAFTYTVSIAFDALAHQLFDEKSNVIG
jgi:hypothetical protein